MASGPAMAKKTTVATKVMKVDVTASGRRTPPRFIVHIIIGPAPVWNGVRYAAQALMPPAITMSRSRTPGCTCRATTQSRVPPPIQSMDASPRPRSIHPQRRFARPERNPCRFSPKNTRTRRTPMSEMTANSSSPRRSRRGVRARGMDPRNYVPPAGRGRGERGPVRGGPQGRTAPPGTSPLSLLSLCMLEGYVSVPQPGHHPQRAAAQSEGDYGRAAAARADRDHRSLRLGKELSRVRHALCRGTAALHRVALHLRQAVPRADAEAPGGQHRRHLARRGHRAEEPDHDEPLHGGHGDRDLRLPAPPVGPRGNALLREVRAGGEGGYRAAGGGRAGQRPGSREQGAVPSGDRDLP